MKNKGKLLAVLVLVLAGFTASAQSVKPIKLGHLDHATVIELMPEYKSFQSTMQAKMDELEKDLTRLRTQYENLVKDYQANEKTYTELQANDKIMEITNMQNRIEQFTQQADETLAKLRDELLRPIFTKLQKAIKDVGDENGFTYIYNSEGLLYASPTSEDIAPLVKKKLGL